MAQDSCSVAGVIGEEVWASEVEHHFSLLPYHIGLEVAADDRSLDLFCLPCKVLAEGAASLPLLPVLLPPLLLPFVRVNRNAIEELLVPSGRMNSYLKPSLFWLKFFQHNLKSSESCN